MAVRIVGITGGSGSGKTWLANYLLEQLGDRAALISQDWYYHDRSALSPEEKLQLNFDHPQAFDGALLSRHLGSLRAGRPVALPRYDYATHRRLEGSLPLTKPDLLVLEGILILNNARLRAQLDLSVFVDVPADVRLVRRLRRDSAGRGIPVEETLRLYEHCVRPMHEKFIQPTARFADIVWNPEQDRRLPRSLAAQLKGMLS